MHEKRKKNTTNYIANEIKTDHIKQLMLKNKLKLIKNKCHLKLIKMNNFPFMELFNIYVYVFFVVIAVVVYM